MENQHDLYIFLKNKALVFLSIREHSELELSRKLLSSVRDYLTRSHSDIVSPLAGEIDQQAAGRLGREGEIIQDLLQELISKNYLSNTRYAEAYILSRARKGYGPNYIKQALRQEGLSQDLIQQVLNNLEESNPEINWAEISLKILNKKFKNLDLKDYKNWQKAQRFLYSRGFNPECIKTLCKLY